MTITHWVRQALNVLIGSKREYHRLSFVSLGPLKEDKNWRKKEMYWNWLAYIPFMICVVIWQCILAIFCEIPKGIICGKGSLSKRVKDVIF